MSERSNEERRLHERVEVRDLKVISTYIGENVGKLVDLSQGGMQIKGNAKFDRNASYKFHIPLDKNTLGKDFVELDAECIWCSQEEDEEMYTGGFIFLAESGDQIITIDQIQSKFQKVH